MAIPDGIEVLRPWRVIDDSSESLNRADRLSARLQCEIPEDHVLHGLRLRAVATRIDRDDVLFEIDGGRMPLALVHMTWRKETNPDWPGTTLFPSWEDWVLNEMLPAHEGEPVSWDRESGTCDVDSVRPPQSLLLGTDRSLD